MNAPDGYRRLEFGEIIKGDDLAFDLIHAAWVFERNLDIPATGKPYHSLHFEKFRKKEINSEISKSMSKNKYKYFIDNKKRVIFACTEKDGSHFDISNESFGSKDNSSTIKVLQSLVGSGLYIELTFQELKKSISHNLFKLICKNLQIRLEKLNICEDQRNEIIKTLKDSRAFNQDSAMSMKNKEDFCFQLAEDGLIKQEKDRFYVENH
jgi:hypothetical protein